MIYGSITYATLTGGGSGGNAYQVRFGYQVLSEDIPNNSRQVKLQLEVRSVKSAYGTYGFNQTSTIDGTTLSSAVFDMRSTNTWQIFGSRTITITGAYNGTKSGSFTTDATTSSGNYTLKSGSANVTMSLPTLHQPPIINTATIAETNSVLTALNVPDTTVVRYLSKKTITLSASAFDNATLTYRIRHFDTDYAIPSINTYQSSNIFNTDYTTHDIVINEGKAQIIQNIKDSMEGTATDWLKVSINGSIEKPNGIAYAKPNLERTSTTIKRKSGNGTNLTDNKANLNLVGTIYKENDVVGNNNSITQIGYKIWENGTSEPASYTTLTPTISGGNVTVTDLEISNINFTKIYNYKIILADNYGYNYVVEDTVPLGQATWTEYKDRVDFLKLTVGGYNPFEYSDEEKIVGEWFGKPLYSKTISTTTAVLPNTMLNIPYNIPNVKEVWIDYGKSFYHANNTTRSYGIEYIYYSTNNTLAFSHAFIQSDAINLIANDGWNTNWTKYITLLYTKTTD